MCLRYERLPVLDKSDVLQATRTLQEISDLERTWLNMPSSEEAHRTCNIPPIIQTTMAGSAKVSVLHMTIIAK